MEVREKLPLSTVISASHTRTVVSKRVVFLGMLFVTFLVVSNLMAFKVAELHITRDWAIDFPAALVFFPLTYFFDDALTEVYGFKISRLIIWGGLFCSAIVTLCTWIVVMLPASPVWDASTNHGARAYELIFRGSTRVLVASMLAYFCGEFLNAIVLAKLKVATQGRRLYMRVMASTAIGSCVDTVIFCVIAFWGVLPLSLIFSIVAFQYVFKLTYEFIMLPVTYWLTNYLKRADNVDYYDTHTSFKIFSLSQKD